MTTIVVHGTQTHRKPENETWWWNSWHEGGFLYAVKNGMEAVSGRHDLWCVNGVPVAKIRELNVRARFFGRASWNHENGHFLWGGAPAGWGRDAGGDWLAAYLNALQKLTSEPLRLIAHSHGCNVVKLASASGQLDRRIRIDKAVFLACPHFFTPNAATSYQVPYKFPADRFGRILNVYCPTDSVQLDIASHLSGQFLTASIREMQSPSAFRTEQDEEVQHLYENVELAADCSGVQAHSVMHGSMVGEAIGAWLEREATTMGALTRIPAHDNGA
jgi:hypothetical protein